MVEDNNKINQVLWCVYLHTNKINNKKYVGITSQHQKRRWRCGSGYSHNKHFINAIKNMGGIILIMKY